MPAKCDRCGAVTEVVEGFSKERRSFRRSMRTLCPSCWQKDTASVYLRLLLCQLLPGPVGLLFVLLMPTEVVGWLFLNVFLFEIFLILSVFPHELGHAWAAKWMGWRVFRIYIGLGKTLFRRSIFGFETEFRPVPLGGLVVAAPRSTDRFRRKQLAFVLAGPLVNFAV